MDAADDLLWRSSDRGADLRAMAFPHPWYLVVGHSGGQGNAAFSGAVPPANLMQPLRAGRWRSR